MMMKIKNGVWGGAKVPYFFFPEKVHVLHIFGENRLIDWKGCIFFFSSGRKKNTDLRSNEWMTLWTFTGKKKHKKKYSFWKKKHTGFDLG